MIIFIYFLGQNVYIRLQSDVPKNSSQQLGILTVRHFHRLPRYGATEELVRRLEKQFKLEILESEFNGTFQLTLLIVC